MGIACIRIPNFRAWAAVRHFKVPGPLYVAFKNCIVSMNHCINALGVKRGDTVDRARALDPKARIIAWEPHMDFVTEEAVMRYLYTFTPRIASLPNPVNDTAWLLLSEVSFEELQDIAARLQASIGVSDEKRIAMLAAVRCEEGKVFSVPGTDIVPFLKTTRTEWFQKLDIFDFGDDVIERLLLFGFRSAWSVYQLRRRHLQAQFGSSGERLYSFLHPPNKENTIPFFQWRDIERSYDFEWPVSEPDSIAEALEQLVADASVEFAGEKPSRIEIILKQEKRPWISGGRILPEPTNKTDVLSHLAVMTLKKMVSSDMFVKEVVLIFGGLITVKSKQETLFFQNGSIDAFIEQMNRRFPGRLMKPVIVHDTAFFPEDEWKLIPAR